jgi:hypothetical protein
MIVPLLATILTVRPSLPHDKRSPPSLHVTNSRLIGSSGLKQSGMELLQWVTQS